MLDELGERLERAVLGGVGRAVGRYQETRPLAVDLLESDEAFLAVFDAPGVTPDDVDVRFDHDAVRVRIERSRERVEGFELQAPGRGLTLRGSVEIPENVPVDAVDANAVLTPTGTLEVHVPKAETDPETSGGDSAHESGAGDGTGPAVEPGSGSDVGG